MQPIASLRCMFSCWHNACPPPPPADPLTAFFLTLFPPPLPPPLSFQSENIRVFSLAELQRATKKWKTVIGRGGYGTVYRAVLKDKSVVAVKKLDLVSW